MSSGYDPVRIGKRLQAVDLHRMFRVIRKCHQNTPLGVVPTLSRFSDPTGGYGVLYASEAVRCSFWEALVRNRFMRRKRRELPRSEVEDRVVVELRSIETLFLVDLRGDGPIRIGAPTAVAHDTNHAAGRALSAATHAGLPRADGFVFQSRFTGHCCVAVFQRAIRKLESVTLSELIRHADFLDALDDYEVTLSSPQGTA